MILLTILIPTLVDRFDLFNKLYDNLWRQRSAIYRANDKLGRIEFLSDPSKSFLEGGLSIGGKRNSLLQTAIALDTKYVCFLDDDESVSPNYLESIFRMCLQGQDVCTFRAMANLKTFWALVDMRLAYKVNDQITPDHTVRRPPWHMCPVKTEFAKLYEFSDKNNAEDFEWMEKVLRHCTTETHTDKILFSYNHGDHSEADKIPL